MDRRAFLRETRGRERHEGRRESREEGVRLDASLSTHEVSSLSRAERKFHEEGRDVAREDRAPPNLEREYFGLKETNVFELGNICELGSPTCATRSRREIWTAEEAAENEAG